ncbi:MAG: Asp23/Gls24 family envelope stress response protein [Corynebacterium sp.]|uniref:Asp23/Gls24 family envelope stress response protein n=1 Tax=Corynebacterium sp. TaxID=1720 RepID=UPI0026DFD51F|nr:Asp23/Gls24 family envelope stress response protein [Corynebacterium sp.]MDO5670991.1 Asp23/Gls24 family envelope stress response protein [Corynebacterium sp.]
MGVHITERAVERIVAAAAASVPGTVELGRGLDRLAGRTYPRYDVIVDDSAGTCSIEAFIAVVWPCPVTAVAVAVRRTVAQWVEDMTGLQVTGVNVIVGPVVPGLPVTETAVADHPAHPKLRPVTVRGRRVR